MRFRTLPAVLFVACLTLSQHVSAFEDLNEPQTLIYDTSHLARTEAGTSISYLYMSKDTEAGETLEDKVVLSIHKERDEARRDISVDFLTGEWKIALPDFDNYRGNPVVIGMLEHLAQSLGRDTGGGVLYFRNRIRDQLANDDVKVIRSSSTLESAGGDEINKVEFTISPLSNDPYVAERRDLTESVITLAFSEDVPGSLLSIKFVSGPADNPRLFRELEFSGVQKP